MMRGAALVNARCSGGMMTAANMASPNIPSPMMAAKVKDAAMAWLEKNKLDTVS